MVNMILLFNSKCRVKEWYQLFLACVHGQSLQSCLTDCDPKDWSLPGSSVYGILKARILEWLPFFLQGIFLTQGSIKSAFPASLALKADSLSTEPPEKPQLFLIVLPEKRPFIWGLGISILITLKELSVNPPSIWQIWLVCGRNSLWFILVWNYGILSLVYQLRRKAY